MSAELSLLQKEYIHKLGALQRAYQWLPDEDLVNLVDFNMNDRVIQERHLNDLILMTIQHISEFSRKIPQFNTISREDQMTLLGKASTEVLVLKATRDYDAEAGDIILSNNERYTREDLRSFMGDFTDRLFSFCQHMTSLEVDHSEYGLLIAISVFTERPGLQEPSKVEEIRNWFISTLESYVIISRRRPKEYFDELKSSLRELVTLAEILRMIPIKYPSPRFAEIIRLYMGH